MLESLKSLWSKWRVQVSVVGGVLVIATAFGTCSVDPQSVSEAEVVPVPAVETEVVPVSTTTTTTEGTEAATTNAAEISE